MKTDGIVEHSLYSLYPNVPGICNNQMRDHMKPFISEACENSPVPCIMVELDSIFKGKNCNGIYATDVGGKNIGELWLKVMRENCIAQ